MGTIYSPIQATDPRPAIAPLINIGKVSQVLSMYDLYKKKAFQADTVTPDNKLWVLIGIVTEVLDWFNYYIPDHPYVPLIGNYLWALITPYQIAALRALGNGNGTVIDPKTGASLSIVPYREDFIVGGAPAPNYPFVAGDSSYTVPLSGFIIAFFEPSGVDAQIGLGGAGLNSITYDPNFVRFNLSQPVVNGEQYTVWGLRGGNITSIPPSSGLPIPLPLQKGAYLTNSGSALLWDSPTLEYTSADFEPDGITVIDTRLAIHDYELSQNIPAKIKLVNGVDYVPILSGGFTILMAGFDANTQDSSFTASMKQAT